MPNDVETLQLKDRVNVSGEDNSKLEINLVAGGANWTNLVPTAHCPPKLHRAYFCQVTRRVE